MRRRLAVAALGLLVLLAGAGLLAWRHQSRLIGLGGAWWLRRVAAREQGAGDLAGRRAVLAGLHRQLLLAPPADAHVPELYELLTQLTTKVATGEVQLAWAAHVYTTWERDLVRDRPHGQPRRSAAEVGAELARVQEFYAIRQRPDVRGVTAADLLGSGDDVITLDEIEAADREGKAIDLRARGAEPR